MIKSILSADTYSKINKNMSSKQRQEWNSYKAELYNTIDSIRDRTRMGSEDLTVKVNYLIELISMIPTFE